MSEIAFTDFQLAEFKNLLQYFKKLAEKGVTPLIEKQLLLMLDRSLPFFAHLHSKNVFPELIRLTINRNVLGYNRRIRKISQLKYPPAEKVTKYGRCNLPGQSILYATYPQITAFGEMKPSIGDLVTISHWKLRQPDSLLSFCPIFKNQPKGENMINPRTFEYNKIYLNKTKDYPTHFRQQMDDLIQFIADGFTREVKPANHLDYIFSAYFSNKILNEFENGTIDAIYYPSVQDGLNSENLAIKPKVFDQMYALSEVHDQVLTNTPETGFRGYFGEGFDRCKKFDVESDGIIWDPNANMDNEQRILELKWKQGFDFRLD